MKNLALIIFAFFLWGASCTQSNKLSNQNLSGMYKREMRTLLPELYLYHVSTERSELHFKINAKDLLYVGAYDETDFRCNVSINCFLRYDYNSKEVLDSNSIRISDTSPTNSSNKEFVGIIDIKAKAWDTYLLEVVVNDLNRNAYSQTFFKVNKYDNLNGQNFLVTDEKGIPAFQQHVELDQKLLVQYTEKDKQTFHVKYYNRDFPIAAPPFSLDPNASFQYKPDSSFVLTTNDTGFFEFTVKEKGFYHFLKDTTKRNGLTLFSFYPNFPEIFSQEQLIEPLRYLLNKQEYINIISAEKPKVAAEEFWQGVGGSNERAKELIRKYYTRVKDANIYFTSYLEGWKSDRGMVYIIHGPPNIIYKTANTESWVYGEENNLMSVTYNFVKVRNPFSDNDYILERSNIYKNSWYRAIDVWRQGRVYVEH